MSAEFPQTTFSVYNPDEGGSTLRGSKSHGIIQVSWHDGPTSDQVNKLVACYDGTWPEYLGKGVFETVLFATHWLCADGRATVAYIPGQEPEDDGWIMESEIGLPLSPDAELVKFSCEICCCRGYSAEFLARIAQQVEDQYHCEPFVIITHDYGANFKTDFEKKIGNQLAMNVANFLAGRTPAP